MSQKLVRGSRIIGTGRYAPERVLTNADLEKLVETSDEWIVSRTGIRERHVARADESCSDLAFEAAVRALDDASTDPKELDAILVGTISGDMQFPATACLIQNRLGASNAAAFDISAACSGFIFGLSTAHALIASGQMGKILVVGVDLLTKFVDWDDRATCVLFGDGGGAAVLEPCDNGSGILGTYMKSDGSLAELLEIPAGGSREPATVATVEGRRHLIKMRGDGVFKHAVRAMEDAANQVLQRAGLTLDDVDVLIPHQANMRIIEAVCERLRIDRARVIVNLERYGNTSAGTIPLALDESIKSGRIKSGDVVLLVTFGGGLTWGSVLFRY